MKHVFLANIKLIESPLVETILDDNKISFFIKNNYDVSVNSGWASPGVSFQEKMFFVDEDNLLKAKKLLKKYI
ncbi:MAG: hypothetical protein CMD26_04445 [Flavobacteriales bacterium]|nr:hypothetical protein [Flavobacteriales bacterium]|tara:strand:- start:375 stop:593 length:219 start_codon:yes stop_codon:yes gene_type:complete